ncbi:MAG: CRISPR system Cascade subunit CasA [Desulfobacteraceae bacterium Eth-SRB2]|nr:MAG: CRISPR system Cascade subunit CasA [Desulfobacteraceae bacterium Eth-SRB2]
MNLIVDPWIPVIRKDGTPDTIMPWQIAEAENPVIEINAPRPDFQGALYQFLIGLLQTCFVPKDEDEWLEHWEKTPSPNELEVAFEKYKDAFELDFKNSSGFMQDHDDFEGEWLPVEDLIGGALSDNTRKGNKDLFVKTKQIELVSPYWAALALFNMQITGVLAWGKHRVGLRGNAPLTTLLMPDSDRSILWQKLWLNVIYREDIDLVPGNSMKKNRSDIFPWMGKTRTSPKKKPTSPSDANPLQHYWAMPRRIRLKVEPVKKEKCDLSGEKLEYGVRFYKRIHDGVYYSNGWVHPLTPYTRSARDKFPRPIEGKYAGEGFRQWVSLNYDEYADDKNKKLRWGRSLVIRHYYGEKKHKIAVNTKLWCFGYDAASANVKCWYESVMPTFQVPNDDVDALKDHVSDALQVAYQIVQELRFSLIGAWFRPQTDSSGKQKWNHVTKGINKAGHLSTYKNIEYEYWESQMAFSAMLSELIAYGQTPEKPLQIYVQWVKELQKRCLNYFDRNALGEAVDEMDLKRVVEAKNYLLGALFPYKKSFLKDINEFNK